MRNKIKGALSVVFMSLMFFLTTNTKYVPALGDLILDFFGIGSWLGDNRGTHLGIIYFGILFLISLLLVGRYAIDRLEMKKTRVFVIFLLLVTSYSYITGLTAQHIKGTSYGLLAIAYDSEDSNFKYQSKDDEVVTFEAKFSLENYSTQNMEFFIAIDNPRFRKEKIDKFEILNHDGTRAIFVLQAGESREFNITLDKYKISGGPVSSINYIGGDISEIVLSNKESEVVKLPYDNFFGIRLAE